MPHAPQRLLFCGPFASPYRADARTTLGQRVKAGARDILYVTASGVARRAAISDLVAQHGAVFGLRAMSVASLPGEIARRARVVAPRPVDREVDDLLIERAVRSACADRFSTGAPIPGITAKVAAAVDLLERNRATPDSLDAALQELGATGDGPAMLACAWRALMIARAGRGHTRAAIVAHAVDLLRERPHILAGCDVVVLEDLPLATPLDRQLIAELVAAAPGAVIAAHGHAAQLHRGPATRALNHLRTMATWTESECEAPAVGFSSVIDRLFSAHPGHGTAAPGTRQESEVKVRRLDAAGEVGEVRLAARVVRRHLREGVKPSEIQIVIHGGGRHHELVEEIFGTARIPVAGSSSRSIATTGIGRAILQLVDISTSADAATLDASLALVRLPHLDIAAEGADRLQRHVVTNGRLGLDDWAALATKALGKRTVKRVNRLRRAVERARQGFHKAKTPEACAQVVRRMARDLRLVGNAFFSRQRLAARAASADVRASADVAVREDNTAWEAIQEALDVTVPAMMDAGGGGKWGRNLVEEWARMLRRALESGTVAGAAASADAVSVVGTGPGMNRPARVTIVMGLLERQFPRASRQDPLLRDELRRDLARTRGWELPTSEETADRERECFVRMISTATETLYLSCAATDGAGKPAVKSFFLADLERALGPAVSMEAERAGAADGVLLEEASTTSELLSAVAHDVWQHLPRDRSPRRASAFATYEAMRSRGMDVSAVTHGRDAIQRPVFADGVLRRAPHVTLRLSASQLKSIGHCTYRHFVQKVLDPKDIGAPDYNALGKGSLIHDAMVVWADRLHGWKRGAAALPELETWFNAQVEGWPPAQQSSLARHSAQLHWERLESLLIQELEALRVAGVAQPAHHELAFGEELSATGHRDAASRPETFDLEIPLTGGAKTVRFRGSLDRVDVVEIGGIRYGVVIDYKTGATSKFYADEMTGGHDLQLRLYMLALREFWDIEPIAALFLGFGDGVRRGVVREQFASSVAGLDRDAVELMNEDSWQHFVQQQTLQLMVPLVDRLVRMDVTPSPRERKCGFCDLQPVCRYDPFVREATHA